MNQDPRGVLFNFQPGHRYSSPHGQAVCRRYHGVPLTSKIAGSDFVEIPSGVGTRAACDLFNYSPDDRGCPQTEFFIDRIGAVETSSARSLGSHDGSFKINSCSHRIDGLTTTHVIIRMTPDTSWKPI